MRLSTGPRQLLSRKNLHTGPFSLSSGADQSTGPVPLLSKTDVRLSIGPRQLLSRTNPRTGPCLFLSIAVNLVVPVTRNLVPGGQRCSVVEHSTHNVPNFMYGNRTSFDIP